MSTIVFGPVAGSYSDDTKWIGGVEPTSADNVQVDSTSANLAVDASSAARSLDFTGYTGTFSGSSALAIGDGTLGTGNVFLKLSTGMTFTYSGTITIKNGTTSAQTITSAGKTLPVNITMEGFSTNTPVLTLADDLNISGTFQQNGGIFNSAGFTITCAKFIEVGGNSRTITITGSTINITSTSSGDVFQMNAGISVVANTSGSTINIVNASTSQRNFQGNGKVYGTLNYTVAGSTGKLVITGSNTFSAINFFDTNNARTLELSAGTTTTLTDGSMFNIRGTSGKLMSIQSDIAGTRAEIKLTKNNISTDYVNVKDIHITGNGIFYAGTHSTNGGNNIGVIFSDPPTRSSISSIWPYLGICIGADIVQGFPNLVSPNNLSDDEKAVFLADADYHISIGIPYVRIACMDYKYVYGSSAGTYGQLRYEFLKVLALRYLAGGVNVQWMVSDYDWTLAGTASNNAFKAFLTTEAQWCESVGITRIQIENELEIHLPSGATKDDAYDWQQELAQVVIDAGFTGIKTTSVTQDNYESWTAQGAGLMDELGLDTYKATTIFESYIASFKTTFGSKAYLSEWGSTGVAYYSTDSKIYNTEIMTKFSSIKNVFTDKPCFFFTWKYWGGEGDDARAACTEYGDIRYFWYNLIGQRNPLAS